MQLPSTTAHNAVISAQQLKTFSAVNRWHGFVTPLSQQKTSLQAKQCASIQIISL
jgi:hypothetical protein